MQACGWTLFDNISATSHVLSSSGEDGLKQTQYAHVYVSSTSVGIRLYAFWDAVAHSGAGESYYSTGVALFTANTASTMRFYCSKDLVYFAFGTTYKGFGHFPVAISIPPSTTLSAPASAGASVTLTVGSTNGFQIGSTYQIIDWTTGCREKITVDLVTSGVSIRVVTLANNYTSGSSVGYAFSVFGNIHNNSPYTRYFQTCSLNASGTSSVPQSEQTNIVKMIVTTPSPDQRNNLYPLVPILLTGDNSYDPGTIYGYSKENFLWNPGAAGDYYMIVNGSNLFEVGTATSGGASVLNDTGKAWGINSLVGKIVILTTGTGANQSRYITSNTATQITVGQSWVTNPIAGTGYTICDEVYYGVNATWACKETFGEP